MSEASGSLEGPARELARGAFRGALEGVRDWFLNLRRDQQESSEPRRSLLILGPGGTGKTTLARLLSGEPVWLDDSPGKYTESIDLEFFALSDDPDVEVVVAPGQPYRRGSTWPELLNQISAGEYRGIMLMNAYGYHTFSTPSYRNHQLYKGSKAEFLKAYFEDRRADELRILRQLVPHLRICPNALWLLSVIAKQDLWSSKQRQVEQHYESQEYAAAIGEVTQALGENLFRHEFAFVSLIIRNLETLARQRLKSNEGGYDMPRLVESLQSLFNIIQGLRAWEEGR